MIASRSTRPVWIALLVAGLAGPAGAPAFAQTPEAPAPAGGMSDDATGAMEDTDASDDAAAVSTMDDRAGPTGWRAEVPVMRVGLLGPEPAEEKRAAWEGWRRFVEFRFGVPIDLVPFDDYGTALRAMLDGQVEYLPLGASGFIELDRACRCVEPVVVVEDAAGSIGFRSFIVSLADGPIDTVADLNGRTVGFIGPNSSAGFLIPAAGLVRLGFDPDQTFEEVRFTGSYGDGVAALLAGDLDATVVWAADGGDPREGYAAGILRSLIDREVLTMDDLTILWESPIIPGGPGVIRSALPQEARDLFRGVLAAMPFDDPEAFRSAEGADAARYVPVGPDSYAAMTDLTGEN